MTRTTGMTGTTEMTEVAEMTRTTGMTGLARTVAADRAAPLTWSDKAVQPAWYGRTTAEVVAGSPTLDDLSTPMMTLDRAAIDHNAAAVRAWCEQAGLSQAPHGKTTMAPALWQEQLDAGCWAITVANEPQLRAARGMGVPRIVVANLLLRPDGLAWLAGELDADPGLEVLCWVDSLAAVRLMADALSAAGSRRPVPVLVELGHPGARTGARSREEALVVAEAAAATSTLALVGVAGYEGSVAHDASAQSIEAVDGYLRELVRLHHELLGRYEQEEAVLSAGGSMFFDRVSAVLGPESRPAGPGRTRVVLRAGAYLVHDDGIYRRWTPAARGAGPELRPAMHVWARVISMPEPGRAYLDAGKRDLPFDEGLPEVQLLRRREGDRVTSSPLSGHEIVGTNDQHAHVAVPADSPLRVGDVVRLGLSHPCTAFDKWSLIPVVDSASAETPVVTDLVRTYF